MEEFKKTTGGKEGDQTILGKVLNAVDPETNEKLSDAQVMMNANLIVVGGSDTTATALTFTLYFLLKERRHWDRLCEEIRTHFSALDEITHFGISKLPFLEAVIYEGGVQVVSLNKFRYSNASACSDEFASGGSPWRNDDLRLLYPWWGTEIYSISIKLVRPL